MTSLRGTIRLAALCAALGLAACASGPDHAPRAPSRAPAPTAPRIQPRDYLGMTPASLEQAMGAPAFVRKDGMMEMWRYDSADCRAFFFFRDTKTALGTAKAVAHIETLPHGAAQVADPACLAGFRRVPPKVS